MFLSARQGKALFKRWKKIWNSEVCFRCFCEVLINRQCWSMASFHQFVKIFFQWVKDRTGCNLSMILVHRKFLDSQDNNKNIDRWFTYCHTRLHLGFSAKLRIWQVTTCKLEPRSGIIIWQNFLLPAPEPARSDPPTAKLFLSMLCGVPTPILPPINKVYAPIFSKKTLGFLPSLGRSPTNLRMVTQQKEV